LYKKIDMARSITEIHEALIAEKNARAELAGLTSASRTAIWRMWLYIVAVAMYTHEMLWDAHKAEVLDIISRMKPHTLKWYAEKARAYQHGYNLMPDSDQYDNSSLTEEQIADSQVVDYAAVVNVNNGLRIKVATDNGTDLEPLTNDQMDGFVEYMSRIKDAGVKLTITTGVADNLKLSLELYYNPLVLNDQGQRLDGTAATPVQDAIKRYLKELPFNGLFVLAYLVDKLQQVDGVVVPHMVSASARYGILPYVGFSVEYQPDSGYLRFANEADLVINWIPKSPI
jgi:hypothetical protein